MLAGTTLQLATRDDASMIARLSRDRIEHGLGWSWTTPRVLRSIRDHETNVLMAREEGVPAGFGIMKYHDDEAHLLLLAVRHDHVRQGVGSALVAWLEAAAVVAGVWRISLEARAGNTGALAFYERLGYRSVGSMPGYYQGREDCVRMVHELRAPPASSG
jgi:ribosomal-protein-alanine N-acetyltransferase